MKETMSNSIERFPSPLPVPFSKAVRAGGFVFLSGQLAMTADGNILEDGIQAQTKFVLERIAASARRKSDPAWPTWCAPRCGWRTWTTSRPSTREVQEALPGQQAGQAGSTVEARLYKGALVEIEVQALGLEVSGREGAA